MRVAKFEKVSLKQFIEDVNKCFENKFTEEEITEAYEKIELPKRATVGSAGYDFKCPLSVHVNKTFPTTIPTGIRVKIEDGWLLSLYPRSGLGFKRGMNLINTVGIIDSDYYHSDNEGHIMTKIIHSLGDYVLQLNQGDSFVQGVFTQYGITEDDNVNNIRNGGFGSTDK